MCMLVGRSTSDIIYVSVPRRYISRAALVGIPRGNSRIEVLHPRFHVRPHPDGRVQQPTGTAVSASVSSIVHRHVQRRDGRVKTDPWSMQLARIRQFPRKAEIFVGPRLLAVKLHLPVLLLVWFLRSGQEVVPFELFHCLAISCIDFRALDCIINLS